MCNTFCQVGAALADASPSWLCELLHTTRPRKRAADGVGGGGGVESEAAAAACAARPRPAGVRLICASRVFSTDWGSSMWRTMNATTRRGTDQVVDCGGPQCAATPLQPELWPDLTGCPLGGDTAAPPYQLFGVPIKQAHAHNK